MDPLLVASISSSILHVTCDYVSSTAIVWDYDGDNVLILTNYHTWDVEEYNKIFPPPTDSKKRKAEDEDEDEDVSSYGTITLKNDNFTYSFILSSKTFLCWNKHEDYAVLQLPKDSFHMPRIPVSLSYIGLCIKIHAFGYIGHTESLNVTNGEIASMLPHGFTTTILSAPGYSGAAILCDASGRAIGYMSGNLDASKEKNSQHQSHAFRFDALIVATHRKVTPTRK